MTVSCSRTAPLMTSNIVYFIALNAASALSTAGHTVPYSVHLHTTRLSFHTGAKNCFRLPEGSPSKSVSRPGSFPPPYIAFTCKWKICAELPPPYIAFTCKWKTCAE
eukprot:703369-Pelagomonas_calceolata.AAC.2